MLLELVVSSSLPAWHTAFGILRCMQHLFSARLGSRHSKSASLSSGRAQLGFPFPPGGLGARPNSNATPSSEHPKPHLPLSFGRARDCFTHPTKFPQTSRDAPSFCSSPTMASAWAFAPQGSSWHADSPGESPLIDVDLFVLRVDLQNGGDFPGGLPLHPRKGTLKEGQTHIRFGPQMTMGNFSRLGKAIPVFGGFLMVLPCSLCINSDEMTLG